MTLEDRLMHTRLPYELANFIFRQGLECDEAARLIRRRLPALLIKVREEVKVSRGNDYMSEKEY